MASKARLTLGAVMDPPHPACDRLALRQEPCDGATVPKKVLSA